MVFIDIPYDVILALVMGLFMLIGYSRGWHREFITSVSLVALTIFYIKPELAKPVVGYIDTFLRLLIAFVKSGFRFDLQMLSERMDFVLLHPENPEGFLLVVLGIIVVLSYTTHIGLGNEKATAISRLMGGLLGLFNGFLAVSLAKEFVIKFLRETRPQAVTLQAGGVVDQLAVSVRGVTPGDLFQGRGPFLLGIAMAVVILMTWENFVKRVRGKG
ncbi:MAG: hypothetical protein H5T64_08455 [Chloroflexi bacterium]|nr:hypothetical protein [Chloroflexota bacterium]